MPHSPGILVCGEALVDLAQQDDPELWRGHAGGSPFNVAIGLARLGSPTSFVGRLSDDVFGRQLRRRLAANEVSTSYVVHAAEPTSLAVVSVDETGVASYVFHMSGTADWQWTRAELPDPAGADAVCTGSLALLTPPGGAVIEQWLAGCRGRVPVCIDPNVRPSVQPDRDVYRTSVERWLGLADVVKASSEDVDWLYPGQPVERVADQWLRAGPALVVVTRGADGAHVRTATGADDVPGQRVDVVDTVGAGDAFTAGLLHDLRRSSLLTVDGLRTLSTTAAAAAARFGVRVAADTCTRPGADPPLRLPPG